MDIEIGPEVWVGHRATILKGSRIGRGAIIGFGSVVAGNVPEYTVAAGNPAKVIRRNVKWKHDL